MRKKAGGLLWLSLLVSLVVVAGGCGGESGWWSSYDFRDLDGFWVAEDGSGTGSPFLFGSYYLRLDRGAPELYIRDVWGDRATVDWRGRVGWRAYNDNWGDSGYVDLHDDRWQSWDAYRIGDREFRLEGDGWQIDLRFDSDSWLYVRERKRGYSWSSDFYDIDVAYYMRRR
ncbi:MAG: hypothetical protein LBQ36_10150 [Synergistaceae bacterium]|jgi:hypothetical protein|nr:hypothetical protein [Synergistaceae bacterium]